MSMPLCGLRGWPLKKRRLPNESERLPGTGGRICRFAAGGALKRAITRCW